MSNFLKLKDDTEIILYNLLTSSMKSVAKKEEYLTKVNLVVTISNFHLLS